MLFRSAQKRRAPVKAKPRAKARRRSSRGAILWIVVGGVLLAGVVFVNLAVLRLNMELDHTTQQRTDLRAQNAQLQSQLSASLASPEIQKVAVGEQGLVQADPSTIGHIDLSR